MFNFVCFLRLSCQGVDGARVGPNLGTNITDQKASQIRDWTIANWTLFPVAVRPICDRPISDLRCRLRPISNSPFGPLRVLVPESLLHRIHSFLRQAPVHP